MTGRCPFHDDDDDRGENRTTERGGTAGEGGSDPGPSDGPEAGVSRRSFVKSSLLIGGASGLSALGDVLGITPSARAAAEPDQERIGTAARRNRQHAWDAYESEVATGNTAQPASSLILRLEYLGDGEPTPADRRQVATALREIERHFAWGAEGVLFTIGYSASYFDRFEEGPPAGAAPWSAERVVAESSRLTPFDPEPDVADAVLLLASENPANPLALEAALWGEDGADVPAFEATFEGVFARPEEWPDRRVGAAGPEFQNSEATYEEFLGEDVTEDIPDESPLSMGFIAGFGESIPAEEAVTLTRDQRFPAPDVPAGVVPTDRSYVGSVGERDPGVFAQGTLKHLSYLTIDLDEWYGNDRDRRRHQMYSPYHSPEETTSNDEKPGNELTTGERGDGPSTDSLVARAPQGTDDDALVYGDTVPETATQGTDRTGGTPTTAHSQKASRARYDVDGDGRVEQPCLRRDWDGIRPETAEYGRRAGYHFNVPMRFNESIFTLLDANYGPEFRSLDGRIDHSDVDAPPETDTGGERNGIAPFMEATRRNNWLVPPIRLRALPFPRADDVELTVERYGDAVYAIVDDPGVDEGADPIDPGSVQFGPVEAVNQARGAEPTWTYDHLGADRIAFLFDADAIAAADGPVKLFAERERTRKPVTAETEV